MKSNFEAADVAVLDELEAASIKLGELLSDARFNRLTESDYPGARYLADLIGLGDPETAKSVAEAIRLCEGDEGAFDYLDLVKRSGLTLGEAAKDIINQVDDHAALRRVEAMRRYAASLA